MQDEEDLVGRGVDVTRVLMEDDKSPGARHGSDCARMRACIMHERHLATCCMRCAALWPCTTHRVKVDQKEAPVCMVHNSSVKAAAGRIV